MGLIAVDDVSVAADHQPFDADGRTMPVFIVPPIQGITGAELGEFDRLLGRAANSGADVGCVRGDDLSGNRVGIHGVMVCWLKTKVKKKVGV